jgi:hypothetical protein
MNRLQRAALLAELADRLNRNGSWCGETHLQKTTYFLQHLLKVPAGFPFIFYKFGPFSFGLRDELTAIQADGLLELKIRQPPYGPSLVPTERSREFRKRYPVTLGQYDQHLSFVCRTLGGKGVADLERLATALFVSREEGASPDPEGRAERLHQLKPHISLTEALTAVREFDRIAAEASILEADSAEAR